MRVLVTGASGFVGSHIINGLKHYEFVTSKKRFNDLDPQELALIFEDVECVIHCAGLSQVPKGSIELSRSYLSKVNVHDTVRFAESAAKAGVKRFIFLSSIKVNGASTSDGQPFRHDEIASPVCLYGKSKLMAEEKLFDLSREVGLEVVVIRPGLVYGPNVKANFRSLMNLVNRSVPLPFGSIISNRKSFISIDNLLDLIDVCIKHPKAKGETFLASDDQEFSTKEMIDMMGIALGKDVTQINVPIWFLYVVGRLLGKQEAILSLTCSLEIDISHTKELLNWNPPQPIDEGFRRAASSIARQNVGV